MGIYDHIRVYVSLYSEYGLIEQGRIPSHDTIRRVLMMLNSQSLQELTIQRFHEFLLMLEQEIKTNAYHHNSLDGKEVRGSGRGDDTKHPCRNTNVLNVYENSLGLCLYSVPVGNKTNEIPVAQDILEKMDLKKNVITFDALHTQRKTCTIIHDNKGIYVAPVKENQKLLLEEIMTRIEKNHKKNTIVELEKRSMEFYYLPKNYAVDGFKGMKTFVKMTSNIRKNKTTIIYFISNTINHNLICDAVECRWEIENGLHKEKDTYLNEDLVHYTNRNAIQNIVVLNNLAMAITKLYQAISKQDMRFSKKYVRAFPVEAIDKVLGFINSDELIEELKETIRKKTK